MLVIDETSSENIKESSNEYPVVFLRNDMWMETITKAVNSDKKTLIMVGAAHVEGIVQKLSKENEIFKFDYSLGKFIPV